MIKLKQDYYGNQDYGKRAFWIYEDGVSTHNFIFYNELKQWVEEKQLEGNIIEIEYDESYMPQDKWKPNLTSK